MTEPPGIAENAMTHRESKAFGLLALILAAGVVCACVEALGEVSVRLEKMTLPTYPYGDPDPVATTKPGLYPYFRYDGQLRTSLPLEDTPYVRK